MKAVHIALGLISCCLLSGYADDLATGATSQSTAAVAPEKIWDMYAEVFAQDLRGPDRTPDWAVAFAHVMTNHPPVALIRISSEQRPGLGANGRLQGIRLPEGSVSRGAFLVQVLRYAYDLDPQFPQNRILVPSDVAAARYDYLDTMPQGGRETLRRILKEQFSLAARREMRKNFILKVKKPTVGLHQHSEGAGDSSAGFRSKNVTMADVANRLSKLLGVDVTDQTQLAGGYDFTLNLSIGASGEEIKAAIEDQLGLELIPAADDQQVEFLVIEKVP